jgi:hypothetical protein
MLPRENLGEICVTRFVNSAARRIPDMGMHMFAPEVLGVHIWTE